MKELVIIGAGASGMMAGIMASRQGARVTVLETNERPGRKLAATGNGRCNFTNVRMDPGAYRGTDPSFAWKVLERFSVSDTLRFFTELGIYSENKEGRMYPRSMQAQSLVDVMRMELQALGAKLKTRERVTAIVPGRKPRFTVHTEGWHYPADAVILACGSCASQIAGSTRDGYELAKKLGHRIVPPLPALTGLVCEGLPFSRWAGVRQAGRITLLIDEEPCFDDSGELQLTEYGISGIPAFNVSRYAARALKDGKQVCAVLDFFPEFTIEGLRSFLQTLRQHTPYKTDRQLLTGLFPEKLADLLIRQQDWLLAIKQLPLSVKGVLSFSHAQVCSGGVMTSELDPASMESLLCPGLYFCGELVDIDGLCGGYNLQWAWSSGALAGLAQKDHSAS